MYVYVYKYIYNIYTLYTCTYYTHNTHTHTHIYIYMYIHIHCGTQKRARAESEAVHAQPREPSARAGADASIAQGFKATAHVAGTPTLPTSKFLKSQDTSTMHGECTRALTFQKAMQRACKALHCGQSSNQPLPRPRLFRHKFSKVPSSVSLCSTFAWGLTCESLCPVDA